MVINSLLIYDYVGGREGVNPDPDKVRISSIICSLVLWPQVGYCGSTANVNIDSCFTISCELVGRLPNLNSWKLSTAHIPGR